MQKQKARSAVVFHFDLFGHKKTGLLPGLQK
jgi:hypothetical protein